MAGCGTKARHEAGPLRSGIRSIRTSRIVFAQELIANERVGVAADHAVAGDDVAGLNGHPRTEAIVRVGLSIVGLSAGVPLGGVGSLGCHQRAERNRSREHHLGDEHFHITSPCTVGYVCKPYIAPGWKTAW